MTFISSQLSCTRTAVIAGVVATMAACTSAPSTSLKGPKDTPSLSTAVVYQTESKEYPLLSQFVYAQAIDALPAQFNAADVVVMDVDETVLDNSQYQRERESQGLGYSSASWQAWVKRKEATLVPGVAEFLEEVIARNGKVALITNRDKSLDRYTWENLLAQSLPLTPQNTCVMGRVQLDKDAVGQPGIVNDKDLRRTQLVNGEAVCSIGDVSLNWQKPHAIVMQIGDNIEDFAGVTQESADVNALSTKTGTSLFILPNPMYGSW